MILPSEYPQSLEVDRDRQIHEATTALLLIGFQNEYFSLRGALRSDIEDGKAPDVVLANTTSLLEQLASTRVLLISAPIIFTPTYEELINPVGALAAIKAKGAFQRNTKGAQLASELGPFVARITHIAGRRGLSAFSNTALQDLLVAKGIRNLYLAGSLSCVCVDSTARAAAEKGFAVSILSDCTLSRTQSEQSFFCTHIFPLYAEVLTSLSFLKLLRGVDPDFS